MPVRRASRSRPVTSRWRGASWLSSGLADDALTELGKAGRPARGQHRQAAQHLRLGPAAQGRDHGTAGQGVRPAGLPRDAGDAGRGPSSGAKYGKAVGSVVNPVLRQGNSDRARAVAGKGLRAQSTRTPTSPSLRTRRLSVATMGDHGLPVQREVGHAARRRHTQDPL